MYRRVEAFNKNPSIHSP